MGQECDLAPGQNVEGMTLAQWKAILEASVAAWNDTAFEAALWSAYLPDSTIATQVSWESLMWDAVHSWFPIYVDIVRKRSTIHS